MNVPFGESDKNFDEYSPKVVLVKVNFSEMGICQKILVVVLMARLSDSG